MKKIYKHWNHLFYLVFSMHTPKSKILGCDTLTRFKCPNQICMLLAWAMVEGRRLRGQCATRWWPFLRCLCSSGSHPRSPYHHEDWIFTAGADHRPSMIDLAYEKECEDGGELGGRGSEDIHTIHLPPLHLCHRVRDM